MKLLASLRTKMIIAFFLMAIISSSTVASLIYLVVENTVTKQAGVNLATLAESQSVTVGNEVLRQIELLTIMSHSRSFQDAVNEASAGYQGDLAAINAQINRLDLTWREADAAANNADPLVQSVLSNKLGAELFALQRDFPDHIETFVTDKYGAVIAATDRTSDYNQADEDWWQEAYANGAGAYYLGQPEYDESTKSFAVNLALPVRSEETGAVVGVLRSTYSLQGFKQFLVAVRFGETGEADLIFPDGSVIGSDATAELESVTSIVDLNTLLQVGDSTEGYDVITYRGIERFISQAKVVSSSSTEDPIAALNWYLVVYQDSTEVLAPLNTLTAYLIYVNAGVLLLATILALVAARSLANPIARLTAVAGKLAAGDLTAQAKVEAKDEIGELATTFNHMADQLRQKIANEQAQRTYLQETIARYADFTMQVMQGKLRARLPISDNGKDEDDPLVQLGNRLNKMTASLHRMITQTKDAAANLAAAATEIMAATTQQAAGASEQSAAITQTTSTANEVKVISEQSSLQLNDVASTSQRSMDVTRSGQKSVQQMIESMAQIKERVEAIAENTLALSEQTQQIGEIITTVSEIATQSNILALNASVEAARAGEHGKGFAVVAMEVRNLAEQSKQATAQVSAILSEIQKATNLTVMATEEGSKGVDAGVHLAAQVRESIETLSGAVTEATQVATQVVASGRQLQTGIEQITIAIQQISQVTVQGLTSTRQTERAAQNLNELALRLNEDIAQYEL